MYVGMGGNTGRYEDILDLCKKNNLKLILDAAHMAGTKWKGKHIGPESDVAVFSYQAVKNLPTADAGMICFKDEELDKLARQLSWLGISKDTYARFNNKEGSYKWYYNVPNIGFKYHGNSIVASIAIIQLKYLESDNKQRNAIAQKYLKLINNNPGIKTIPIAKDCYSSRHLFQILVENRDEIIEELYRNSIFPGVHYINNTEYAMYDYAKGKCKNAEYYGNRLISLPMHLNLNDEDINSVINVLNNAILKLHG